MFTRNFKREQVSRMSNLLKLVQYRNSIVPIWILRLWQNASCPGQERQGWNKTLIFRPTLITASKGKANLFYYVTNRNTVVETKTPQKSMNVYIPHPISKKEQKLSLLKQARNKISAFISDNPPQIHPRIFCKYKKKQKTQNKTTTTKKGRKATYPTSEVRLKWPTSHKSTDDELWVTS